MSLALLARIATFLFAASGGILTGEGRVLADVSTNILEGRGLSLSGSMLHPEQRASENRDLHTETFEFYRRVDGFYGVLRPGVPTTFFVPGYPLFMASVFAIAGAGDLLAVRAVQLLLGLLAVRLGLWLAARYLRGIPFLLAGLFIALDPFELYYEAIPATQALFGLLFTAAVCASVRTLARPSTAWGLSAAALWALSFHVRPISLPLAGWFVACLLLSRAPLRRRVSTAATAAALFAAMLVPWASYLHDHTGTWRITPTQGGVNLWEANARMFSSSFVDEMEGASMLYGPLRESYSGRLSEAGLAEFPEFRDEPEWVRDSILTSRTVRFLRANPGLYPRLALLRFAEFFKPYPFNRFPVHYLVMGLLSFGMVLVFAGAGAFEMLRRRTAESVFLVGAVAGYSLSHVLMVSGTPHRVALDFVLAVLAGAGLCKALSRIGSGSCRA